MRFLARFLGSSVIGGGRGKSWQRATAPARKSFKAEMELLEDRMVPSGITSITGNFNGTAIPGNDALWFSSVAKVQGLGSSGATLHITNQSIAFMAGSTPYQLSVPDAVVILSPATTSAGTATTFDTVNNVWNTTAPTQFSGNVFLSGLPFEVPSGGLPGGIHNVTWQMQVSVNTANVTVNWQWAAAVYSNFSSNPAALGVKPVDDNHLGSYQNSDHAGTPEAFKSFVTGGATGGGGSNFTGSYSGTGHVIADQVSSLSGVVFDESSNSGLSGVVVTLTGTDYLGHSVVITTSTAANGSFQFSNLVAGTYTITETPPAGYTDDTANNTTGSAGGSNGASQFTNISLNAGVNGVNYNFAQLFSGGGSGGGGGGGS
jgi:hypothetical protein